MSRLGETVLVIAAVVVIASAAVYWGSKVHCIDIPGIYACAVTK